MIIMKRTNTTAGTALFPISHLHTRLASICGMRAVEVVPELNNWNFHCIVKQCVSIKISADWKKRRGEKKSTEIYVDVILRSLEGFWCNCCCSRLASLIYCLYVAEPNAIRMQSSWKFVCLQAFDIDESAFAPLRIHIYYSRVYWSRKSRCTHTHAVFGLSDFGTVANGILLADVTLWFLTKIAKRSSF